MDNRLKKNNGIKAAKDLIYTFMATVIMQLVLQLIIYPITTRVYGDSLTGTILYFVGIIYIVPQALGATLNNTRLVVRKKHDITNRDFLPYIAIFSGISGLICGYIGLNESASPLFTLGYVLFSIVFMLRLFASVEFRLTANFKGHFTYYCIVSAGYLLGFGLFLLTDVWLFIFIVGESFGVLHSLTIGKIFRNDGASGNRKHITKTLFIILMSTIVRDCVTQFDRLILKQTISESIVAHYNAVSLIAKTVQMLVQPINTLLLTYLTTKEAELNRKQLLRFTFFSLLFGLVFYGFSILGTPIFVKLFYPSIYDEVMPYNLIVNLGLIMGFVSTLFMSILLTQGKTGLQMVIQCVWGATYIIAAYVFTNKYQIWGLAYITLAANVLKLIAAVSCVFLTKSSTAHSDKPLEP